MTQDSIGHLKMLSMAWCLNENVAAYCSVLKNAQLFEYDSNFDDKYSKKVLGTALSKKKQKMYSRCSHYGIKANFS